MINVKQEWRKGLIIFSVFVIILAATVWAFILNNQIVSETSKSVNQDVSSSAMPVASLMPEASVKPVFAIFNGSGLWGGCKAQNEDSSSRIRSS